MNLASQLNLGQMEMVEGIKNFIESADINEGDRVFLLADTRSDPASLTAVCMVLKVIGATPTVMVINHLARYSTVPPEALPAAKESDCFVLVWPVFITSALNTIRQPRTATSDFDPSTGVPGQPKLVYLESAPDMFASEYARFPNKLLWAIAEKVKANAGRGHEIHIECTQGSDLTSTYDPAKLYALQTRPVEPGGRNHFPWGRCGIFHGAGVANGVVYMSCIQGIPGVLDPPMKVTVQENLVIDVEGGEVAQHIRSIMERSKGIKPMEFNEIMFGFHPKAPQWLGNQDYMHWPYNSKGVWVGLGGASEEWPRISPDGPVFHSSVWIDGDPVMDNGRLLVLQDPELRELASQYGDPFELLDSPVSHAI
ncbi:MAG: hypothetical protein IIC80_04630 [Chloroflexi bacterium]|nr:hypothetical protein [Chloroflexota bacterium]